MSADYRKFIKPAMERIFTELKEENVPLIMFGVGASHLAKEWNDLPLDVIGLDWRLQIEEARANRCYKSVTRKSGSFILISPLGVIEERAKEILDQGMAQPGYIFNLGHGVFPEVKSGNIEDDLTAFVHEYSVQRIKV